MNLITAQTTYATQDNAVKALARKLAAAGLTLDSARYLIAVNAEGRFVPTLVGAEYLHFAHVGVMVVG